MFKQLRCELLDLIEPERKSFVRLNSKPDVAEESENYYYLDWENLNDDADQTIGDYLCLV